MRLSKITTRTGDDGTTGLADGARNSSCPAAAALPPYAMSQAPSAAAACVRLNHAETLTPSAI